MCAVNGIEILVQALDFLAHSFQAPGARPDRERDNVPTAAQETGYGTIHGTMPVLEKPDKLQGC